MTFLKTLCCFLLFSYSLHAQEMEIRLGGNFNQFYHFPQSPGIFSSDYENGYGGHLGVGWPNLKVRSGTGYSTLGLYLHYDYYRGKLDNLDGGRGGYYWTNIDASKHVLGFAFYPINIQVGKKRLRFSLGPEVLFLLSDELLGTTGSNLMSVPLKQDISAEETRFSAATRAGLNVKIGGRIPFGKIAYLVPQYDFSWGLTNEFKMAQGNPKSLLHRLSIGWVFNLNKEEK